MNRSRRLGVSIAAAVCGLALSAPAFAAYNPSLIVAGTKHSLGNSAPIVVGVGQDTADDATAAVTIYSPPGYGVTLGQAPGTQLGTVSGLVKVASLGNQTQNVEGTVKADNPANHVTNPCSPGAHEAVWVIEFSLLGSAFRLPVYVDRITSGPEAAYASAKLQVCFPSPHVAPPQGSPGGSSVVVAAFSLNRVFRAPTRRGSYAWNSVFVPYVPGTATANTANPVQSTSYVRLPIQFTMNVKRQRRGKRTFAQVTACVKEAGQGVRGLRVTIRGGATTGRARRVASGRTNSRGCTKARVRVKRRSMVFYAIVEIPARQAATCTPTLAPRCSSPSIAPAFDLASRAKRVRR